MVFLSKVRNLNLQVQYFWAQTLVDEISRYTGFRIKCFIVRVYISEEVIEYHFQILFVLDSST